MGHGHRGVVGDPRVRVGLEGGCCMVVVAAGMRLGFIAVRARDADSQRIQFEFAEFAANSFATRIRCKFGVKFRVLRIRGEFGLRIRRRQATAAARAVF